MKLITRPSLFLLIFFIMIINVWAQEGGTISGKVTLGGNPMPNMEILVMSEDEQPRKGLVCKVTTDAEGRYKATVNKPNTYIVKIVAPSYPFSPDGGFRATSKTLTISKGDNVTGIDFSFQSGGVITGRITGFDGKPLIATGISLEKLEEDGKKIPFLANIPSVLQTDDRGIYRIYRVPPGKYILSIGTKLDDSKPYFNYTSTYLPVTYYPGVAEESAAQVVEVKEGKEINNIDIVALRPAKNFRITGKVIDSANGKPIEGLSVTYTKYIEGKPSVPIYTPAKTNSRGEFQINGLIQGKYFATTVNYGEDKNLDYYSENTDFEIIDGDVNNIEIKAYKGVMISGSVTLENSKDNTLLTKLYNSQIVLRDAKSRTYLNSRNGKINSDGSFTIRGVQPGEFQFGVYNYYDDSGLSVTGIEYQGIFKETLTITGEPLNGVRVLTSYGTGVIRGEVNITGKVSNYGYVYVTGTPRGRSLDAAQLYGQIDERKHFIIKNVVAGSYDIAVTYYPEFGRPPIRSEKKTITIDEGGTVDINLAIDINQKDQPKEDNQ